MANVKNILRSLEKYFEREKSLGKPWYIDNVSQRMSVATGLSPRTLERFLSEGQEPIAKERQPKRQVEESKKVPKDLDSFDQAMVRNKIHELYKRNEVVTLRKLRTILQPEMEVPLTTLWRTIRALGFRFIKKGDGKRVVMERADVVSQRHQYLRDLRRARARGDHVIYLDETWVNVNHTRAGEWSENRRTGVSKLVGDGCGDCGRSVPTGKGKRIIVLDAGCRDVGLLPAVADVFVAKSDTGDYHTEMNHEHFVNWWTFTLLPALPGPSTIVLDQAPYHCVLTNDSRAPTSQATVGTLRTWLRDRGIAFTDDQLKAELLEIVRRNKPRPRYVVDELAAAAGHRILRLPPRHCELNPIELIWARIKDYVARNNTSFKLTDTMNLFHQGRAIISADVWNTCEDHVINKFENVLWDVDGVRDDDIEPVIISFDEAEDAGDDDDDMMDDDPTLTSRTDDRALDDHPIAVDLRTDETGDAGSAMETDPVIPCLVCDSVNDPPVAILRKRARGKKGRTNGCSEVTFEWVQCDACEKWAHVDCIARCDTSGIFYCPPCKSILHTSYK